MNLLCILLPGTLFFAAAGAAGQPLSEDRSARLAKADELAGEAAEILGIYFFWNDDEEYNLS